MLTLKKILLEKPEANPDDIFGEYIFGSRRLDEPASNEPNTEKEDKFIKGLNNHFQWAPYDKELAVFVPEIFKLIKQGKYLDFLKPGDQHEYAYRLLFDFPIKKAEQIFGVKFSEIIRDKPYGTVNKNVIYKPLKKQKGLSSWTVNLSFDTFAEINGGIFNIWPNSPRLPIIFRAKIKDNNFFLNPDNIIKKTKWIMVATEEEEVISYGDVIVDKFSYVVLDYENSSDIEELEREEEKVTYDFDSVLNKLIDLME
jgi:hypothetical protein